MQFEQVRKQALDAESDLRRICENHDVMVVVLNHQSEGYEWATSAQVLQESTVLDPIIDPWISNMEEEINTDDLDLREDIEFGEDIESISVESGISIDLTEYPWEEEF